MKRTRDAADVIAFFERTGAAITRVPVGEE